MINRNNSGKKLTWSLVIVSVCLPWLPTVHPAMQDRTRLRTTGRPCLNPQPPLEEVTELTTEFESAWPIFLEPLHTKVREDLLGTTVLQEIRNVSKEAIPQPELYIEYFDERGRLCFTSRLLFSDSARNKQTELHSDGTETLSSLAYYLAPSVQPQKARLYVLAPRDSAVSQTVRLPIRLSNAGSSGEAWERLWVGADDLAKSTGPVLDLVLARVAVDSQGRLTKSNVVKAVSEHVENWFGEFLARQRFVPASRGPSTENASALVLVRAALSNNGLRQRAYLPRESPWVRDFVATAMDAPTVITILLFPTPEQYYCAPPSAAFFAYDGFGSDFALQEANRGAGDKGEDRKQPRMQ